MIGPVGAIHGWVKHHDAIPPLFLGSVESLVRLIDQLHALRRQLRAMSAAMAELPEDAREAIARRLTTARRSDEG